MDLTHPRIRYTNFMVITGTEIQKCLILNSTIKEPNVRWENSTKELLIVDRTWNQKDTL